MNRTRRVVGIDEGGYRDRFLAYRDELVSDNLALVPPIAARLLRVLPPSFELSDLLAAGNLGLIHAANRYRPLDHGGAPFPTFARPRIHGAMVDSIRRRNYREATHEPLEAAPEPSIEEDRVTPIDAARRSVEVWRAVATLTPEHRAVMVEHYKNDENLLHVGRALGLKQGRAIELHDEAIETLRRLLA